MTEPMEPKLVLPRSTDLVEPSEEGPSALPEELTEAEKAESLAFAKTVDMDNPMTILQFGSGVQREIARFSDRMLRGMSANPTEDVETLVSRLMERLENFIPGSYGKGSIFPWKKTRARKAMEDGYGAIEADIDEMARALSRHKVTLMKDMALLEELYALNLKNYKELTMYIYAGEASLEAGKALLPEAKEAALPPAIKDDANAVASFEKRLHDLRLSRTVSMQLAPQIRLLQRNDQELLAKINTILTSTIPLWKNQMVLSLGLAHATSAMEMSRQAAKTSQAMMANEAKTLKRQTKALARESAKAGSDAAALAKTNQALLNTLDDIRALQRDGAEKRQQTHESLEGAEADLRNSLV